ncbi:helix-turn-helix domain-containing protein [Ralstonia soli]|uniref:Helix-turn-helix transcriptional regulator n=1 Tax=Ralstonia soli TaxID=2953896 RepID=A0ABT1AF54_9RALS|nr:helix-turn-helix transcriptional regulator [Ralstonia soli]MCO5396998.1 helix-turn-helix transcriptional regulator [Ralstonia soli]
MLKDRNLRYRDLAEQLNVSETTIKRHLTGHGLSVAMLESLCAMAGIRLIDLAELAARRSESKAQAISVEQEQGLADAPFTAFIFMLLRYDWTPQAVQQEFGLDEPGLILHLRRLEKLRLLDLFPGNRVRLLTVRHPQWIPGGPLRRAVDDVMRRHFATMDFHDPQSVWQLETVKLSRGSIDELRSLIASLSQRMQELAANDRTLPAGETAWYSMLCTARLTDPRIFWAK